MGSRLALALAQGLPWKWRVDGDGLASPCASITAMVHRRRTRLAAQSPTVGLCVSVNTNVIPIFYPKNTYTRTISNLQKQRAIVSGGEEPRCLRSSSRSNRSPYPSVVAEHMYIQEWIENPRDHCPTLRSLKGRRLIASHSYGQQLHIIWGTQPGDLHNESQ